MGTEQGPEYYDHIADRQPLDSHPRRDLYVTAAAFLPAQAGPVADLGCGSGLLAQVLAERGVTGYWGVDFSPVNLEVARERTPGLEFTAGDFFDPAIQARFPEFANFFLLEVLERIDRDMELVSALPAGSLVVVSLPSFDDPSHVRTFAGVAPIRSRYGGILDIHKGRTLQSAEGDRIYLFSSRKI